MDNNKNIRFANNLVKKRKIQVEYNVYNRWKIQKDLQDKYHLVDMRKDKSLSRILQSYNLQNIFDRIIMDCGFQNINDKKEEMEKLQNLCHDLAQIQNSESK